MDRRRIAAVFNANAAGGPMNSMPVTEAPQQCCPRLYLQVLAAIVSAALLGIFDPGFAVLMQPLRDGFIQLIRMLIAPIICCTVVHGIAGMSDLRKAGRVALKA